MHEKLAHKLGLKIKDEPVFLLGAEDSPIRTIGSTIATIQLASQLLYDVKFIIASNVSHSLILGSPFLNLVAPQIDYKSRNLWFEDPSFKKVFFPPNIEKTVKVRAPYDLVIPAGSEVVLPIAVKAMDCSAPVEPTVNYGLDHSWLRHK